MRATPVTWTIVAIDVAAFAWVAATGSATDTAHLVASGALERSRVWAGEWWRLVTAAFLHVGILHLVWNTLFGVPLSRAIERALGPGRFASLYLLSAVGASAVSLLGQNAVSAGASGALFGVAGAMFALYRRALGSWGAFFRERTIRTNLVLLAVFAVATMRLPVDQLAHGGGLLTGATVAWIQTRPRPRRAWAWIPFAVALAALVAVAVHPPARWRANRDAIEGVAAALEAHDVPLARQRLEAARARGLDAPGLDYQEGVVRALQGDLEGALTVLDPLAKEVDHEERGLVDATRASVMRELGARLIAGDGRPRDPARGRALLESACGLGDAKACAATGRPAPAR